MSDRNPRILSWLRRIDANIDSLRAEQQRGLAGVDEMLEAHDQRLAEHDEELADHERRLARLERKVNGRAGR